MEKNRHISIRIEKELLKKLHYVARYENRSASGQIMFLIHNCIREFEEMHGKIENTDDEQLHCQ